MYLPDMKDGQVRVLTNPPLFMNICIKIENRCDTGYTKIFSFHLVQFRKIAEKKNVSGYHDTCGSKQIAIYILPIYPSKSKNSTKAVQRCS